MKSLKIVFGLLAAACALSAQQYTISTIAGIPYSQGWFGDTGPATSAQLDFPFRITVDSKGNYYFADYLTNIVREVTGGTVNGTINTIAGTGSFGFQGDGGPGYQAYISDVHGLAVDAKFNVYIADTYNARIRIVNSSGVINTFAGNGTYGYTGDGGPATSAELFQPAGVAVDSSGNVYIADYGNYTVRKVDTKGNITTIAGTGVWGYSGDGGPANKAMLGSPEALAIDSAGNIFIADPGNSNIREITTDGNIHTVVSNVMTESIAVDGADSIYYPDFVTNTVRKVLSNGTQYIIAGIAGSPGFSGDLGPATSAQLNQPSGVALDSSGNVYVADSANEVIRLLTPVSSTISVENAASGVATGISPGEIITLYGTGLGPSTGVVAAPGANGYFGTQALGGTTVGVNGVYAPLIYASASQVSAIVPYETPVGGTVNLTVGYQGQIFTSDPVPVVATIPGIFTANASGTGQAAVVNQDGTINGPNSPAHFGSVVSLYLTGEGQTTPAGVDGKPATVPLPQPLAQVIAFVNGQPAIVTYAGGAPGLVAGLMQLNVQIPANLIQPYTGPVAVPVSVQVGYIPTQANVTITVAQ
jgi:uncharacterized protein (TIGR03437 family)